MSQQPEQARLGLTVGSLAGDVSGALDLCREAEGLGYTDAWSEESGGTDGFGPLVALALTTERLRLGTAIVPVFTRPPALLAMHAATVSSLSGGRFALGLGTSSSIIVERWMGGSFDRPLTRLREYVEILREALAGAKVSYEGETVQVRGFRLQHPPPAPVPITLAALGPKACRLAGRVADGVAFFLKSPDGVRQAMGWVAEGAKQAGRDPGDLDVLIRLPVAIDEDPGVLEPLARRLMVGYAMVDVYNRSLAHQGFENEAREIADAWQAGERDRAAGAITGEMLEELFVMGDAEHCRRRIQAFREAGVTTPVLLPVSLAPGPEERADRVREAIRALAPALEAERS